MTRSAPRGQSLLRRPFAGVSLTLLAAFGPPAIASCSQHPDSPAPCPTCAVDSDCPAGNECSGGLCTPFVSCTTRDDCPQPSSQVCRDDKCRSTCTSNSDCIAQNLLCDVLQSVCAPINDQTIHETPDDTADASAEASSGGTSTTGGSGTTSTTGTTGTGTTGGTSDEAGLEGGSEAGLAATGGGDEAGLDDASPTDDATTPTTTYDVIDDLEDNDGRILVSRGRQGPWHIFNSADGNGGDQVPSATEAFSPVAGGADGTQYAVHTTGSGYSYGGVGFDLNNTDSKAESAQSQSYDASAWDGIVFYAKGSVNLRVEFPMKQFVPTDRGGACTDSCWNVYGSRDLQGKITSTWVQYKIPFATLERDAGGMDPPFDPSQLMSISFKHEGDDFDFWIDEVKFYKDPPATASRR